MVSGGCADSGLAMRFRGVCNTSDHPEGDPPHTLERPLDEYEVKYDDRASVSKARRDPVTWSQWKDCRIEAHGMQPAEP